MTCENYPVELQGVRVESRRVLNLSNKLKGGEQITVELNGSYSPNYLMNASVKVYDPTDQLVFNGIAMSASYRYEKGDTITSVQCSDYGALMHWKVLSGTYDGAAGVVLTLLADQADWNYGATIEPMLSVEPVTLNLNGQYFDEAVDLLCSQINGIWDIELDDGSLKIFSSGNGEGSIFQTIRLPFSGCIQDGMDFFNANFNTGAPEATRLVVFGKNGEAYANRDSYTEEIAFDVMPSSSQRTFPLMDLTTAVLQVRAEHNPPIGSTQIVFVPGNGIVFSGGFIYFQDQAASTIRRYNTSSQAVDRFAGTGTHGIPPISGSDISTVDLPIQGYSPLGIGLTFRLSFRDGNLMLEMYNGDAGSWSVGHAIFTINLSDLSFARTRFDVTMDNDDCVGSLVTSKWKPMFLLDADGIAVTDLYKFYDGQGMTGATIVDGDPDCSFIFIDSTDPDGFEAFDGTHDYYCYESPTHPAWPLNIDSSGVIESAPWIGYFHSWFDPELEATYTYHFPSGDSPSHTGAIQILVAKQSLQDGVNYAFYYCHFTTPFCLYSTADNASIGSNGFYVGSVLSAELAARAGGYSFPVFSSTSAAQMVLVGTDIYLSLGEVIIRTPGFTDIDAHAGGGYSLPEMVLSGTTEVVVGKIGEHGYRDAVDPLDARLGGAHSLQVVDGSIYFIDEESRTIRRYNLGSGAVETVLGLPCITASNFVDFGGTSDPYGFSAGDVGDTRDAFVLIPSAYFFEVTEGDNTPINLTVDFVALNGWTSDIALSSVDLVLDWGTDSIFVSVAESSQSPGGVFHVTISPGGSGWQIPPYGYPSGTTCGRVWLRGWVESETQITYLNVLLRITVL